MRNKKKPITPKTSLPLKLLNIRTLEPQKPPTTNDKTYLTIQDNLRTFQNAETQSKPDSLKATLSFNKKFYHQRMEQHNLSPFSNDGRSASPKYRKTPQKLTLNRDQKDFKFAFNLKELQKKKPLKLKASSARESYNKKSTTPSHTRTLALNSAKQETITTKKKPVIKKKKSDKSQKQEKARIEFQNEFLSMMNNRIHKQKITEMSDEEQQGSNRKKKPTLEICIQSEGNSDEHSRDDKKLKQKKELVKTMQLKVMKNIQRDYPNLEVTEKRVICAVIIVQRLWRQRKVKQFFEHYVTPRVSPECSFRDSLQKQSSTSTMNLLAGYMGRPDECKSWEVGQVPRKRPNVAIKADDNFLIRQKSEESFRQSVSLNQNSQQQSARQELNLNQKVTRMFEDSILPFQNENEKITKECGNIDEPSMVKFIECYRQIKLSSGKKQMRRNIFSLKQSLSEKCLMQKYYTKIFSDRPLKGRPKNYQIFSPNNSRLGNASLNQNQQSSIELFREMGRDNQYLSPRKQEIVQGEEVWVRNQTSYGEEDASGGFGKGDDHVQRSSTGNIPYGQFDRVALVDEVLHAEGFFRVETDEIKTDKFIEDVMLSTKKQFPDQSAQQETPCCIIINKSPQQFQTDQEQKPKINPEYSLKSIQTASESILTLLLSEFFAEYLSFQQKQCLVKKHRKKEQEKQKKPKLPGIEINAQSITQYLDILIPYILNDDRQEVLRSLELFHPSIYQRCHRVQSSVYELFEFSDEDQDELYWNIITNEGFFACLEQYWQGNVTLNKDQQKFTNFLDLTYKVYNRCVTDAFSQLFNRHVLQKVVYSWNPQARTRSQFVFDREFKTLINPQLIETIAEEVKQKLLKQCFCYSSTGGKLMKKDRKVRQSKGQYQFGESQQKELMNQKLSEQQFAKVMKIADDEFLQDQRELLRCVDERYELCGDLSEAVLVELMKELEEELLRLEDADGEEAPLTKSQQQVFLQTNETLETNYHC